MPQKLHYNPLIYRQDIRLIRLATQTDDPVHATGPVHCRLLHASLEDSHLVGTSSSATKGSNGTWPVNVVDPVDKASQFDTLFERSLLERVFPWLRIPEVPSLRTPNCLRTNRPKVRIQNPTTAWHPNQDAEADLPWRYTWGDFVALSYVWGDASITREIYVNGMPVQVTANLEAALRELRNHSRIQQGFLVWVDALCINQADLDERAAQVARMKDIYQSAWHVVIWLGPEENRSDLAMLALQYISLHSQQEDVLSSLYRRIEFYVVRLPFFQWMHSHTMLEIRKAVLYALYRLLSRPYWRRLWIIQEVALGAKNSPMLCGGSSILLGDILKALDLMKADGSALGRYIIFSARGTGKIKQRWNREVKDTYGISEKLWERPGGIIALQSVETLPSAMSNDIYDALLISSEASAADDRDRVYGILGLPQISSNVRIVPDYTREAPETFILFSARLLASGNLNGLRLVNSPVPSIGTRYLKSTHISRPRVPKLIHRHRTIYRGCEHGLPSWVICWSCPRNPALPFANRVQFSSGLPLAAVQITSDNLLTVKGIIFDTVTTLSAFHATESDRSYPHNTLHPPESPYGDRDATREALARTLTGGSSKSDHTGSTQSSAVLHPLIWELGLRGIDSNIFGLKDFYRRNRTLQLFDSWSLESLVFEPKKVLGEKIPEVARTAPRLLRTTDLHREALMSAMMRLGWRRLITTRKGYFGIVPAAARAGDVLAVIGGCDMPILLRPLAGDDYKGRFSVVGEAYVHWMKEREVYEFLEMGIYSIREISIQ
ncbi:heterokaryon incompatibility protein [Seiridium cupressi]